MKRTLINFVAIVIFFVVTGAWAGNNRPSSGRYLPSDHWLTCWGGEEMQMRQDPLFTSDDDETEIAAYIPEFSGAYTFEVKDTWEEWVTHSGYDCFHCGETCVTVGYGDDAYEDCSCNYCSWQELETFYDPWSRQRVDWHVKWEQDQEYRRKYSEWVANGRHREHKDASNLDQLLEFDPNRPLEYYLFPGEVEKVKIDNNGGGFLSGGSSIEPEVSIGNARHEYSISTLTNGRSGSRQCDDVDLRVEARIKTGKRLVTRTPNSIEFHKGWVDSRQNGAGELVDEPVKFYVTDIAARRYEVQNVFDHYKDTQVKFWLREIDRAWWFDQDITEDLEMRDNVSILEQAREGEDAGEIHYAVYQLNASDLFKTPVFNTSFRLRPGRKFELCTSMWRKNNVYYYQNGWPKKWIYPNWSDKNCAMFTYNPPDGVDHRSGWRKFVDSCDGITCVSSFLW